MYLNFRLYLIVLKSKIFYNSEENNVLFAFLALIENEDDKLDFEEIYYKYKDATFRRALWALNNNHYDAEEAFQIAWGKIAKNIDNAHSL